MKINEKKVYPHELGLNSFCDLTQQEVSVYKHGLKLKSKNYRLETKSSKHLANLNDFLSKNNLDDKHVLLKNTAILESSSLPSGKDSIPNQVDWKERGFVSRVKDQGECGACWVKLRKKN